MDESTSHRFVSDDEDDVIPDMEAYTDTNANNNNKNDNDDNDATMSFLDFDDLRRNSAHRRQLNIQYDAHRRPILAKSDFEDDDPVTRAGTDSAVGSFLIVPNTTHEYPVVCVRHLMIVTVGMAMANSALNAVFALYVNEFFGVGVDSATAWTAAWNIVIWSAAPLAAIGADRFAGSFSTQRWAFVFWILAAIASLITTVPAVARFFDTSSPLAMSPDTIPLFTFAVVGATGQAIGFGIVNTLLPLFLGDQFVSQPSARAQSYVYLYFAYNVGVLIGEIVGPILRQEQSFLVCFIFVLASLWLGFVAYVSGSLNYRSVTRFAPTEGFYASLKTDFLAVTHIAGLYLPLAGFWALFVQLNSTFVFQAKQMDTKLLTINVPPDGIPAIEDIGVLLAIVVVDRVVDPLLGCARIRATPLRKIGAGLVFCVLSFVAAGLLQIELERAASAVPPRQLSVWLQVPQILLMSISETLVVISGLQFGYTASPGHARTTVFALWSFSTALGATVVVSTAALIGTTTVMWFFGYAAVMLVCAIVFVALARRFR
jgi:dipeptide/tripeptide permease